MESTEALRIEGEVQQAGRFDFQGLSTLPHQVPDLSQLIPGREGGGVRLHAILEKVGLTPTATYLTLKSTDGKFSASVPLTAVQNAIVAYRLGDGPLPEKKGGPFRFFIPDIQECAIGEVDACANVKFLGLMQVSRQPDEDNRPTSKPAHEEHHTKEGHEHLE
jgi:hypothetical protein